MNISRKRARYTQGGGRIFSQSINHLQYDLSPSMACLWPNGRARFQGPYRKEAKRLGVNVISMFQMLILKFFCLRLPLCFTPASELLSSRIPQSKAWQAEMITDRKGILEMDKPIVIQKGVSFSKPPIFPLIGGKLFFYLSSPSWNLQLKREFSGISLLSRKDLRAFLYFSGIR